MAIEIYSDAQRCKTTGEIIIGVRAGCPCEASCTPDIGAIPLEPFFAIDKGERRTQEELNKIFIPAKDLKSEDIICSRDIDWDCLKNHLQTLK